MPATRRIVLLMLVAFALLGAGRQSYAQIGPPAGLVNQAAIPLAGFRGDGPGWFYYGINAADRGLGYNGSYMTLGGFIPYAEDDMGGLWAADVRSHLSVNGGFFSNVGAVRKQFIGGTLLGVGVYWDYDGDLNQYPIWGVPGTEVYGQFGHVYNQVGISGEWLTDFGNLRSNGYIPLGTTAYTRGAPGYNFAGNYLLCETGLDTALGGADLEVGAYVPGLADWGGMISVGGYAYGNDRYQWEEGSDVGAAVVPWFGGVFTRLDMTFANNWDFSLRANNDSFFDWTGYARLTYRMGGSRRRNVPDQVEQPMMRNEHIVRAHQTPIVAVNPVTNQPWNVIHVDNTAQVGGNGTAAAPVRTLALAQDRATQPYDIVYVHAGDSQTTPYESVWQFQADNQILVGEGSLLDLNTASCGYRRFFQGDGTLRPVLTSTSTAITLRNGAIVDHFLIDNAPVGITANNAFTGIATVNDVIMSGNGQAGDLGVYLVNVPAGSAIDLYNMQLENVEKSFVVNGGAPDADFQGLITNTSSPGPTIQIGGTTGGVIRINETIDTLQTPVAQNNAILTSLGIDDQASTAVAPILINDTANTTISINRVLVDNPTNNGVLLQDNTGSTISLTNVEVSESRARGVVVLDNTGTTAIFDDLLVTDATDQAFLTQGNDAASLIQILGESGLSSSSTTLAAFESNDDSTFNIQLTSVVSSVLVRNPPLPAPPPATNEGKAILLNGASSGSLTVTDRFLVADPNVAIPGRFVPGTLLDNVENNTTGPVTVAVP
jgi:hypothetical protein